MVDNLNIVCVNNDYQVLENTIKNFHGISIIYSNMKSSFMLKEECISTKEFIVVYNEGSNTLLLLLNNGNIDKNSLISELEDNDKEFAEVTFNTNNYLEEKKVLPEIVFVRDNLDLIKILKELKDNNVDECTYYPDSCSKLEIGYFSKYNDYTNFYYRAFNAIIEIDNKVILLSNVKNKDIWQVLRYFNLKCNIIGNLDSDKVLVKKLAKKGYYE